MHQCGQAGEGGHFAEEGDCNAALARVLVGKDPEALRRWVVTQTRWVPYRGCLRGAIGVLMDRRGNHLDRSLLLAELLAQSGSEVRLARASLATSAVPQLVAEGLVGGNDLLQPVGLGQLCRNRGECRVRSGGELLERPGPGVQ